MVGIDPGTTAGVAVLDLDGNLVLLESGKNLPMSEITELISSAGMPVVITSDIAPPPRIIERIASSFGARLYYPKELLSKREKLTIVKEFADEREMDETPWRNQHEKDALASVLYAWRRLRPLIRRVKRKTEIYSSLPGFPGLLRYVNINVIIKGRSISKSVEEYLGKRKEP